MAPVTVRGRLGDHAGALGQARDAARLLAQGVRKGSRGQGRRPRGSPVASDATILWRRDARRRPDTIRAPLTTGWATVPRAGVAQNPPPFRGQGRHTLGVLDPDPRPRSTSSGSWSPVDRVDAAFPLLLQSLLLTYLPRARSRHPRVDDVFGGEEVALWGGGFCAQGGEKLRLRGEDSALRGEEVALEGGGFCAQGGEKLRTPRRAPKGGNQSPSRFPAKGVW